jgi:hypothetical protein
MKKTFLKIASINLAFLVLFSTFSFAVEKHYCGDFLVNVSYTGHIYRCGMKMDTPPKTIKKRCCRDEVQKIEGQGELQQSFETELKLKGHDCILPTLSSTKDLFVEIVSRELVFKDFSPPDIPLDYQVLYQNFLI